MDDSLSDRQNAVEARFQSTYSEHFSRAALRLEQAALDHAVGLHGYTTLAQAQMLAERLAPTPGELLLDMGAGRGWPGVHLARTSGCSLIALDIPVDALRAAQAQMPPAPAGQLYAALVADGRAVPLATQSVDGVIHADSF